MPCAPQREGGRNPTLGVHQAGGGEAASGGSQLCPVQVQSKIQRYSEQKAKGLRCNSSTTPVCNSSMPRNTEPRPNPPLLGNEPLAWRQKEKGLPQGHRGFLCKGAEPRPAPHRTALQQTPLGQSTGQSQHNTQQQAGGRGTPQPFPTAPPRQPPSPPLPQQHHSNQPKCQAATHSPLSAGAAPWAHLNPSQLRFITAKEHSQLPSACQAITPRDPQASPSTYLHQKHPPHPGKGPLHPLNGSSPRQKTPEEPSFSREFTPQLCPLPRPQHPQALFPPGGDPLAANLGFSHGGGAGQVWGGTWHAGVRGGERRISRAEAAISRAEKPGLSPCTLLA